MTTSHEMQRLEAVLSAYGADRTRWPQTMRAELDALIARDPRAAAMVTNEAAFDDVLGLLPAAARPADAQGAKERLLSRFDAEIEGSSDEVSASETVVPFPPRQPAPSTPVKPRGVWQELSVMAASLLIGFFAVSAGLLDGTGLDLSSLRGTASQSQSDTDDVSAIAFGTTGDDVSEEYLL